MGSSPREWGGLPLLALAVVTWAVLSTALLTSDELGSVKDVSGTRSDTEILTWIQHQIKNDESLTSHTRRGVSIEVKGGKVTLKGNVSSADEKKRIERHAVKVVGNRGLQNRLRVRALPDTESQPHRVSLAE